MNPSRYPFDHSARAEIGPAEFGKLFGGNGYFDSFFKKNLEDHADISQGDWKWRKKESAVAMHMSDDTLRQLQRAARIKAAFFPTNGNTPMIPLTVTPRTPPGTGFIAKLEISGIPTTSSSNQPNLQPGQVSWTGTPGAKTAVSVSPDPPNPRTPPSEVAGGTTPWALFRLLDKTQSKSLLSTGITASWSLYGQEVSFQIITTSTVNPFDPRLFTEFKCPGRL